MLSHEACQLEVPHSDGNRRHDRRGEMRVPLRISLVVKTLDLDSGDVRTETINGWTEDISTTGTRIICPRIPLTGQLWVNLRTRRLRKHWFEVQAIWSNGVTTTRGLRQRVGISFVEPLEREELDRMLVARALTQLRATMPRCIESLAPHDR